MDKTIGLVGATLAEEKAVEAFFSGIEGDYHCRFTFFVLEDDNVEDCKKADAILSFRSENTVIEKIKELLRLTEVMIFYRNFCLVYPKNERLFVSTATDNYKNEEMFDRGGWIDSEIEKTWRTALDFSEEKGYNVSGLAYWDKETYNSAWQRVLDAIRCEYPSVPVDYAKNDEFLSFLSEKKREKVTFVCDCKTGCKNGEAIASVDEKGERIVVTTGKTNVAIYTVFSGTDDFNTVVKWMAELSFDMK